MCESFYKLKTKLLKNKKAEHFWSIFFKLNMLLIDKVNVLCVKLDEVSVNGDLIVTTLIRWHSTRRPTCLRTLRRLRVSQCKW